MLNVARTAHAADGETIRIGLVGCGNRGTGACREALLTDGPVQRLQGRFLLEYRFRLARLTHPAFPFE